MFGLAAASILALTYAAFYHRSDRSNDRSVPNYNPDLVSPIAEPPEDGEVPTSTGFSKLDKIFELLKKASDTSKVPLGVLVGWIASETGGDLSATTKLGEKGYFQVSPKEADAIKMDLKRIATDPIYSINSGLALIGYYSGVVERLDVAEKGSSYFYRLIKLAHTVGPKACEKFVSDAKAAGKAGSWSSFETYAFDHDDDLFVQTKQSPVKWLPLVDKAYRLGKPFGFGTDSSVIGAELPFNDIVDPLDVIDPK